MQSDVTLNIPVTSKAISFSNNSSINGSWDKSFPEYVKHLYRWHSSPFSLWSLNFCSPPNELTKFFLWERNLFNYNTLPAWGHASPKNIYIYSSSAQFLIWCLIISVEINEGDSSLLAELDWIMVKWNLRGHTILFVVCANKQLKAAFHIWCLQPNNRRNSNINLCFPRITECRTAHLGRDLEREIQLLLLN